MKGRGVQNTLKSAVSFAGIGLHGGRPVRMTVRPAAANQGIWFCRTDITDRDPLVPAVWSAVVPSPLCTTVANEAGVSVATIEHLMAALAGCAIHNALIEISGPEVPVLDGSAAIFVRDFLARGIVSQAAPLRAIRILEPIEVTEGAARAALHPADTLEMDFTIDFAEKAIGHQHLGLSLANGAFARELANSRTFCRQSDVDAMRARGLALGGTLENAVVFDGARVLSPGGLRRPDEPVRHKMLDALGDLALAGAPIIGRYVGQRAGHALTARLVTELFAHPGAFRIEECGPAVEARLPGIGVRATDLPAPHPVAA